MGILVRQIVFFLYMLYVLVSPYNTVIIVCKIVEVVNKYFHI